MGSQRYVSSSSSFAGDGRLQQDGSRVSGCALVAMAGFFFGSFTTLAVFAVGAGHVALNQVNRDGGQAAARAGSLAVGYAIGIFRLLITVMSVFWAYT
ncbi:hypothetical protein [Arthrobacter sp. ZGTC412]|uniref:hypothetical protein n=1 Tax=Arthrobacter sp. ZGTC412 TaxID=2058900 RepID=UPI0011B08763|nr:hypothetical protein [Arthrobacter sp. ZGTC412]